MSRAALAQFVGFNKLVESQSSSNKKGADELKVKLQTGPSKKEDEEEEVGGCANWKMGCQVGGQAVWLTGRLVGWRAGRQTVAAGLDTLNFDRLHLIMYTSRSQNKLLLHTVWQALDWSCNRCKIDGQLLALHNKCFAAWPRLSYEHFKSILVQGRGSKSKPSPCHLYKYLWLYLYLKLYLYLASASLYIVYGPAELKFIYKAI